MIQLHRQLDRVMLGCNISSKITKRYTLSDLERDQKFMIYHSLKGFWEEGALPPEVVHKYKGEKAWHHD